MQVIYSVTGGIVASMSPRPCHTAKFDSTDDEADTVTLAIGTIMPLFICVDAGNIFFHCSKKLFERHSITPP